MTMLTRFTPAAQRTLIRAGIQAADAGRDTLSTDHLLLALTESQPLAGQLASLGITAEAVRAEIEVSTQGRHGRELLATLGIDVDEVRRRAFDATRLRRDDPSLWRLSRSRCRPLRVVLAGPAIEVRCDEGGRKVLEVAVDASRRARRPLADPVDVLRGLFADASNEAVRILRRQGVELRWINQREAEE